MKKVLSLFLSVVMLLSITAGLDISAFAATSTININVENATYNYDYANEVLKLINQERAKAGLSALKMDSSLLDSAMLRSAECSVYFSHTRPDLSDCFTANSKMSGENIAFNYSTPQAVVDGWMNSPGHKANILNSSFTSIGIGCVKVGSLYWTQCFGRTAADGKTKTGTAVKSLSVKTDLSLIELYYNSLSSINDTQYPNGYQVKIVSKNKGTEGKTGSPIDPSMLTFSSSNTSIFTVDAEGKIFAKSTGTATFKATLKADKTKTVSKEVTIKHVHKYETVTVPATLTSNGNVKKVCSLCKDVQSDTVVYSPKTMTLSATSFDYRGSEITPGVTVKDSQGTTLSKNQDYTVTYQEGRINAGKYSVVIDFIGKYSGSKTLYFDINPISSTKCNAYFNQNNKYEYTGKMITPEVTVKNSTNQTLEVNKDYTLTYASGRTEPGTYTVVVNYIGNYTGSQTLRFYINPISSDTCTAKLSSTTFEYTGKAINPEVIIKDAQGNLLKNNTDYTLTYEDDCINPGTYYVIINYTGKYTGTDILYYSIVNVSSDNCTVKLSSTSYEYNGKAKTPNVTVTDANGQTLVKNTDYTVSYQTGRVNVGRYSVTVNFKGKYSGSRTLYFNITAMPASKCSAKLSADSFEYSDSVIIPGLTVTDANGTVLEKGVDYTITHDDGRINVGTYTQTVSFKGNYSGTKTLKFNITPKPSSKCSAKLSATQYEYTGKPIGPGVSVTDDTGRKLVYKTDYTLTYASGRVNPGRYSVVVNYIGNYSGSTTLYFTINEVNRPVAKLSATSYEYTGKDIGPGVTVTDSNGSKLVYKTDYTLTYATGRTNVGRYGVTVNYIGKYAGTPSETLYFDITPKPARKCTAKLSATQYEYTGKPIGPGVTVTDDTGRKLVYKTDYTLVYDQGRTEPGKYCVTVNYQGNYTGSTKLYFTIKEPVVNDLTAKLSAVSYVYTGKDIGPGVTVTDNKTGAKLVYKTDYTLTYAAGRTSVGTYGITVNYIGKYAGTPSEILYFNITPKSSSQCTAKPSAWSYYYTGKEIGPGMTVTDNTGRKLVYRTDYTLTYEQGRTKVGRYSIKVNYIGNYTGSHTIYFYIIPKQVALKPLVSTSQGFNIAWNVQKEEITGYQVQYSQYSNFSNSGTLTIANPSAGAASRTKMGANKTYYVRIRTYKYVTVDGKTTTLFSGWSDVKTVVTGK